MSHINLDQDPPHSIYEGDYEEKIIASFISNIAEGLIAKQHSKPIQEMLNASEEPVNFYRQTKDQINNLLVLTAAEQKDLIYKRHKETGVYNYSGLATAYMDQALRITLILTGVNPIKIQAKPSTFKIISADGSAESYLTRFFLDDIPYSYAALNRDKSISLQFLTGVIWNACRKALKQPWRPGPTPVKTEEPVKMEEPVKVEEPKLQEEYKTEPVKKEIIDDELEEKLDAEAEQYVPEKILKDIALTEAQKQALGVIQEMFGIVDYTHIDKVVRKTVRSLVSKPKQIIINDKPLGKIEGLSHKAMDDVMFCLTTIKKVFLTGPAGTGKTFIAKQAKEAFKYENYAYFLCNAETGFGDLWGIPDIHDGTFIDTHLLTAYENGNALICLDEVGRIPGAISPTLNSATEFGTVVVPLRKKKAMIEAGPNLAIVAIDNTKLKGMSERYTSDRLDGALVNRFRSCYVEIDYDTKMEKAMAEQLGAPEIADMVWDFRKAIEKEMLDDEMGLRQIADGCRYKINGAKDKWIAERFLTAYISEETEKVKPYISKYLESGS